MPYLDGWRPADLTLAWWERDWPHKWDDSPRGYHRDRIYWRLVVELFDRLRAGELVASGLRTGLAEGPETQTARPGWWSDPGMVLRLSGEFAPEQRPSSLPTFIELTLSPKAAGTETPAPGVSPPLPQTPSEAATPQRRRNRRGPRPVRREATIGRMLSDYAGEPDRLEGEKLVLLASTYEVSNDTVAKARRNALLELRKTAK